MLLYMHLQYQFATKLIQGLAFKDLTQLIDTWSSAFESPLLEVIKVKHILYGACYSNLTRTN